MAGRPTLNEADAGLLDALLHAPLGVTNVEEKRFPSEWITKDEVIVTYRFLYVLAGELDYGVEGRTTILRAGDQMLIPAWTRRVWRMRSKRGGRLLWVEFAADRLSDDVPGLIFRRPEDGALEVAALRRMLALWTIGRLSYEETGLAVDGLSVLPKVDRLLIEAELKAALARFWRGARWCAAETASGAVAGHPEVVAAVAWLRAHYAEPDALERFYRRPAASPNHLRRLFREAMRCTARDYLARLRLRRARFLAHHSEWPLKRIATEVGYRNPLYFSRHYKQFWGHPPTRDRPSTSV